MVAGTFHLKKKDGRARSKYPCVRNLKLRKLPKPALTKQIALITCPNLTGYPDLGSVVSLRGFLEGVGKNHKRNQKLGLYSLPFHSNVGASGQEF